MSSPRNPARRAEVVRRYSEGGTLRGISEAMRISHETVRQNLKAAGVALRGRGEHDGRKPEPTELTDEIYGDLVQFPDGATVQQLAEWLGERRAAVSRAVAALIANGQVKLVRVEPEAGR